MPSRLPGGREKQATAEQRPWSLYHDDATGYYYRHNHSTGESQWAEPNHHVTHNEPLVPSRQDTVVPRREPGGRGIMRNREKTQVSARPVRVINSTSSRMPDGRSDDGDSDEDDESTRSWDSELENRFSEHLETPEGLAQLQKEQQESEMRLEVAQTTRQDGLLRSWLLPYHNFDEPVVSDVSDTEEDHEIDESSSNSYDDDDSSGSEGTTDAEGVDVHNWGTPTPSVFFGKAIDAWAALVSWSKWAFVVSARGLRSFALRVVGTTIQGGETQLADQAAPNSAQHAAAGGTQERLRNKLNIPPLDLSTL